MKIAVTYENGLIFQHFGRTETFKLYEVEDNAVISSEVIGTDGTGHEALADFLAQKGVEVVICGGLGEGAENALYAAGIRVLAGIQGDADAAVEAFLNAELEMLFPTKARFVAHPAADASADVRCAPGKSILLAVGPEGGWTEQEVALLEEHDFARYSLGPRILRTDTALVAVIAQLMKEVGE